MKRMDENQQEESECIHNSLAVIENMIQLVPSLSEYIVEKTEFISFLFMKLKETEFGDNQLYASETLSILLQSSPKNRSVFGKNGIEALLEILARYRKKKDLPSIEEEELVENIFNAILSCLLLHENQRFFLELEGIDLMLLIIKYVLFTNPNTCQAKRVWKEISIKSN